MPDLFLFISDRLLFCSTNFEVMEVLENSAYRWKLV